MGTADGLLTARAVSRLLRWNKSPFKSIIRYWSLTWCISIVTVDPAFTGHFPATPRPPPALHRMSLPPTLVTGLLLGGARTHWDPCCGG